MAVAGDGASNPRRRIDLRRYLRALSFFARLFFHAAFWDLLLRQPGLRVLRRPPLPRWLAVTRRFRELAVDLGGVFIKLGQFLSTRVDVLPREITDELAGLQDEVPAAPFAIVEAQLEEDYGQPIANVFPHLDPRPIGAASLAQVYRAALRSGEEVVVKVLRPGIEVLVETDLRVIAIAIHGLKLWSFVRRRVDVDRLAREFVTVTRRELDLEAEGRHAERFAADFAADAGVHVPRVFWPQSHRRALVLEDVGFVKLNDLSALEAAGIDLRALARKLWDTYLEQIFTHNFVHADPHPGNLFVEPLDETGKDGSRPFRLAFVDFGMVAEIPQRLRRALRELIIALGSRDAARLIYSYRDAGFLLPGADIERLIEAHEEIFDRFWGVEVGNLRDRAFEEMGPLLRQYRDLVVDYPFQAQIDLVFVQRSLGILIGLVTYLDPEFDLFEATRPFAARLAREGEGLTDGWLKELLAQVRAAVLLPRRLERLAERAGRGELVVQNALTPEAKRLVGGLEGAVDRLTRGVVAVGLAFVGIYLGFGAGMTRTGWILLGAAGLLALAALWRR